MGWIIMDLKAIAGALSPVSAQGIFLFSSFSKFCFQFDFRTFVFSMFSADYLIYVYTGNYAKLVRLINWALIATMIVLSDINTAPTAGESKMPKGARTPAARGKAITL